jgi:hypothetical protein
MGAEFVRFVRNGDKVDVIPVQKNGEPFVGDGSAPVASQTA